METSIFNTGNTGILLKYLRKKAKKSAVYSDRAATYNRCSTLKQHSVEWQEEITAAFVKQQGWMLVKAFGAKESAKTDDRKEFQEMLSFCKKENISHIVFYNYDRFSRAGKLDLIDDLREKHWIKVHSCTQFVDDETADGRMMQKFHLLLAKKENEDKSQRVKIGQIKKLKKGEWNGEPPMGYEKRYVTGKQEHPVDKKQCFINKVGEILRQAFYWKDKENLTNTAIISRLKTMGLKLKLWHLTKLFRNPFYCGLIVSNLLNGEVIRGKHEPLVDEATWLRINGLMNKLPHGWKVVKENPEVPLKTSVRCSKCGRPFTGYRLKTYVYYKCPNKGCCRNITSKKLHQLFLDELSKFEVKSQLIPFIKTQLDSTYGTLRNSESAMVKPMKDELARLKNELDIMESNLAIGELPYAIYQKRSAMHEEKIRLIGAEVEKLGQDSSNLQLYLDSTLQYAANLREMWEKLDYNGKVRLQKLVFPSGLKYMPENQTVRTLSVNPIFAEISSISTNIDEKNASDGDLKSEKLPVGYHSFTSSNFLWENLEKTAVEFEALGAQLHLLQVPIYSMTGSAPTFSAISTTTANALKPDFSAVVQSVDTSYTGTTVQHLFG